METRIRFLAAETAYLETIASIHARLERYRKAAMNMSPEQLESEKHNSERLGRHLRAAGKHKPDNRCDAHAIIAGKHRYAIAVRFLLANINIRIDDPDNGCRLPRTIADTPHWAFRKAVAHSQIHRANYYHWVASQIPKSANERLIRNSLNIIGRQLQQGNFPNYVMLPKGVVSA